MSSSRTKKKLIEVALPLGRINEGSKPETENPFLKGHPRSIHNWWARTPLSVSRAVLFAQLIDDPGNYLPEKEAEVERERLLDFVGQLATWEGMSNSTVIEKAKKLISNQFNGEDLCFWDMFGGRGSIPLEAQRLGLSVRSTDLNPVAVTIQKGLLEYPSKFRHRDSVSKKAGKSGGSKLVGSGFGLVDDIRWYGKVVEDRAKERLSDLYPKSDGKDVLAWLWARTIKCPNPACGGLMPLVSTLWLAKKKIGLRPVVDSRNKRVRFLITTELEDVPKAPKAGRGANFRCLICREPVKEKYVKQEGLEGRMGFQLLATACKSSSGVVYDAADESQVLVASEANPSWFPEEPLADDPRNIWVLGYGLRQFGDLFTPRQLVTLATIRDLIVDVYGEVLEDSGDDEYARAIATYLACALSRMTDYHNSLTTWNTKNENISHLFQRQCIPMSWDFCEANPISGKITFGVAFEWIARSLDNVPKNGRAAVVEQMDARRIKPEGFEGVIISTDPPYYDNISYADLGDFFYVWLRAVLRDIDRKTFATMLTPKDAELIAAPTRHDTADLAEAHFRDGFQQVFSSLVQVVNKDVPMTVYYAFKQEEVGEGGRVSTGWETMLEGLVESGFQITGTWPVRTTKKARAVAIDTNALASTIVLVCRPRSSDAPVGTLKEFLGALNSELPRAVHELQQGNIAPVDLAQAAIGPGMAIYSQYSKIIQADGEKLPVRRALKLINDVLDKVLTEDEGDFDADTRWALAWYEQFGHKEGPFGEAEKLSKAKNTAVNGLVEAGILVSKGGKVRLLERDELLEDWDYERDKRATVWEITQYLVRSVLDKSETDAAIILKKVGSKADVARDLAYRLFSVSERKKWSQDALAYNSLVLAFPQIRKLAESMFG